MSTPAHSGIEQLKKQWAVDTTKQREAWSQVIAAQARMEQVIEGLTDELSQTARRGGDKEVIKSAVVDAVTKAHESLLQELGDRTDEDHKCLLQELGDMKNAVLNELRSTSEVRSSWRQSFLPPVFLSLFA
jgi:hypothetical protein